MRRFAFLATIACLCGCALSGPGRADTITENFTITIGPPAVILTFGPNNDFFASVPQFNPANGTLTSVSMSLSGSGTWFSNSGLQPILFALGTVQNSNQNITGSEGFIFPGVITINVSGSDSDSGLLGLVTGTGSLMAGLQLQDDSQQPSTDTFQTSVGGIAGTLTYTFTTPEPASLTLFGISALGVLGYAWRKRKRAAV
jgi:hypothetical protein